MDTSVSNSRQRRRTGLVAFLVLIAVTAACGGGDNKTATSSSQPSAASSTSAASTAGPAVVDRASMEACLRAQGLTLAAGDTPLLSGVHSIGVVLGGGGNLMPGNVSAAVFVYDTADAANSAADALKNFAGEVTVKGNVAVMWDSTPEATVRSTIEKCAASS